MRESSSIYCPFEESLFSLSHYILSLLSCLSTTQLKTRPTPASGRGIRVSFCQSALKVDDGRHVNQVLGLGEAVGVHVTTATTATRPVVHATRDSS